MKRKMFYSEPVGLQAKGDKIVGGLNLKETLDFFDGMFKSMPIGLSPTERKAIRFLKLVKELPEDKKEPMRGVLQRAGKLFLLELAKNKVFKPLVVHELLRRGEAFDNKGNSVIN
jgi:hypothetical protein